MTTAIKSNATSGEILVNGVSKLTIGETTPPTTAAAQGAGANELVRKDYVDGKVPVVAFSANATTGAIPSGDSIITWASEDFDVGGYLGAQKFTPLVAGYYAFSLEVVSNLNSAGGAVGARIKKNGALISQTIVPQTSPIGGTFVQTNQAAVFLNGTTDYVEGVIFLSVVGFSITAGKMTGILVSKA